MSAHQAAARSPADVVGAILANPTDLASVRELVAPDGLYVLLSNDNPDLKRLMPWAGTTRGGAEAIVDTYLGVARYWKTDSFQVEDVVESGDKVAMFGRFTYRSTTLDKTVSSPFSLMARVSDGRVTYMQFLEDTFATTAGFRVGGQAVFHADPDGGEVVL